MSWRSGSSMFIEFWPIIQRHMPDREHRVEFTAEILKLFMDSDMDPYDLEGFHPEVDAALAMSDDFGFDDDENDEGDDDEDD